MIEPMSEPVRPPPPFHIVLVEPEIPPNTGAIARLCAATHCHLHLIEPLGAYDIVDLKIGSAILRARTKSRFIQNAEEKIWIRLDPSQTHLFNSKSGQSLNIRLGNGAN